MVQIHAPAPSDDHPIRAVARVLEREDPAAGETWLLAFSGGPDSTALAAALAPLAAGRGLAVRLAHVDHGLDPDSAARADAARTLAARLGLPYRLESAGGSAAPRRGESPEAAARRARYALLERVAAEIGATRILTGHQRDDQVETVLLRLLAGSGLEGLAGIPERRDRLLRPLLEVTREAIDRFLAGSGLVPVRDPTNLDLRVPRNHLRHLLLPRLRAADPELDAAVLAVARRAAALRRVVDAALGRALGTALEAGDVAVASLLGLPCELRVPALARLLRRDLPGPPPSNRSMEAFLDGLRRSGRGELRLGDGARRLVARGGRVKVGPHESPPAPFSYTFPLPGEVLLERPAVRLRVRRSTPEPWMLRGEAGRAGLALPEPPGLATVRSRRPGDRIRPLGAAGERKLKELLIDRRVPAEERDRLPLLEIGGRIAWIPGVAVDESFRLTDRPDCWVAELLPADAAGESGDAEAG